MYRWPHCTVSGLKFIAPCLVYASCFLGAVGEVLCVSVVVTRSFVQRKALARLITLATEPNAKTVMKGLLFVLYHATGHAWCSFLLQFRAFWELQQL